MPRLQYPLMPRPQHPLMPRLQHPLQRRPTIRRRRTMPRLQHPLQRRPTIRRRTSQGPPKGVVGEVSFRASLFRAPATTGSWVQSGDLGRARYDEERSRPEMDAVVLRVDGVQRSERPLLHEPSLDSYYGSLFATGPTWMTPNYLDSQRLGRAHHFYSTSNAINPKRNSSMCCAPQGPAVLLTVPDSPIISGVQFRARL